MRRQTWIKAGIVAVLMGAGVIAAPAAQAATPYCSGNVIDQINANGFSSRLIESYDGTRVCVNTWNQTGHQAWTYAFLQYMDQTPAVPPDRGYYYQYASTGFTTKNGCYMWGGAPTTPGGTSTYYYGTHCF
jgi:hypothetical protein